MILAHNNQNMRQITEISEDNDKQIMILL
uniref:Uncharacterized protein n=1 Tax=Arundo donax TaxID=35708 RepID=A0A0A9A3H1_ARUDO